MLEGIGFLTRRYFFIPYELNTTHAWIEHDKSIVRILFQNLLYRN